MKVFPSSGSFLEIARFIEYSGTKQRLALLGGHSNACIDSASESNRKR
jgi:hypothetical protein